MYSLKTQQVEVASRHDLVSVCRRFSYNQEAHWGRCGIMHRHFLRTGPVAHWMWRSFLQSHPGLNSFLWWLESTLVRFAPLCCLFRLCTFLSCSARPHAGRKTVSDCFTRFLALLALLFLIWIFAQARVSSRTQCHT